MAEALTVLASQVSMEEGRPLEGLHLPMGLEVRLVLRCQVVQLSGLELRVLNLAGFASVGAVLASLELVALAYFHQPFWCYCGIQNLNAMLHLKVLLSPMQEVGHYL